MTYAAGLTAVVAAAVTLAGCTGESPTAPATSAATTPAATSTSTSPTSTPSTSTPATSAGPVFPAGLPDAAKKENKAGAEAFIGYFVAQVNAGWRKPDSALISALCLPQSKSCDGYADLADDLKTKSQRYKSDAVRVTKTIDLGSVEGLKRTQVTLDILGASVIDAKGALVDKDKASTVKNMFFLKWGQNGWRVAEIENF
jgi:hypothetical protein